MGTGSQTARPHVYPPHSLTHIHPIHPPPHPFPTIHNMASMKIALTLVASFNFVLAFKQSDGIALVEKTYSEFLKKCVNKAGGKGGGENHDKLLKCYEVGFYQHGLGLVCHKKARKEDQEMKKACEILDGCAKALADG